MKFQKDIVKFLVNAPAHVWIEVEHHMGLVMEIRAPRIVWGNIKDLTAFNLAINAEAKNNYTSFRRQHKHSHIRKNFKSLDTRRKSITMKRFADAKANSEGRIGLNEV